MSPASSAPIDNNRPKFTARRNGFVEWERMMFWECLSNFRNV